MRLASTCCLLLAVACSEGVPDAVPVVPVPVQATAIPDVVRVLAPLHAELRRKVFQDLWRSSDCRNSGEAGANVLLALAAFPATGKSLFDELRHTTGLDLDLGTDLPVIQHHNPTHACGYYDDLHDAWCGYLRSISPLLDVEERRRAIQSLTTLALGCTEYVLQDDALWERTRIGLESHGLAIGEIGRRVDAAFASGKGRELAPLLRLLEERAEATAQRGRLVVLVQERRGELLRELALEGGRPGADEDLGKPLLALLAGIARFVECPQDLRELGWVMALSSRDHATRWWSWEHLVGETKLLGDAASATAIAHWILHEGLLDRQGRSIGEVAMQWDLFRRLRELPEPQGREVARAVAGCAWLWDGDVRAEIHKLRDQGR